MSVTVGASTYAGTVLPKLYQTMTYNFEMVNKQLCQLFFTPDELVNILNFTTSDNPFEGYTFNKNTDTVTADFSEKQFSFDMFYLKTGNINPYLFRNTHQMLHPTGSLNDLMQNPMVVAAELERFKMVGGRQLSKLAIQGDKTSGDVKLNFTNGLIKQITDSGDYVTVPNLGVITSANVKAVIESTYESLDNYMKYNEKPKIIVNPADFTLIQKSNLTLTESFNGYLNNGIKDKYFDVQIVPIDACPKDTVLAGVFDNTDQSSLLAGFFRNQNDIYETVRIGKEAADKESLFIKMISNIVYIVNRKDISMYSGV